jgi:hypothetical protein
MSGADPKSADDLRALARRSPDGLSKNDRYELDRAMSQSGPLGRELGRIAEGRGK